MGVSRIRKAIATAVGMAITLVLLVPEETIPEQWRPYVGLLLLVGTVLGVYQVRNDRPVTREDLKRKVDYWPSPPPERHPDPPPPPTRHVRGDRPPDLP